MKTLRNHFCICLLLATLTSHIHISDAVTTKKRSRDDFVQVQVPEYVREGSTAFLKCLYDVDHESIYSMKWYKGAQEFFRFTPKESPPIKVFPAFGGQVDITLSNFTDVALVNVNLNMTDKYTCEVTKDFPDYTTSLKTGKMTVVALPKHKPMIATARKSTSISDTFKINCTSFSSNPVANITWLLNGFPVGPHYLTPPLITQDENSKETITAGLNFTVRQQDFIRGRMTLSCQASIEPGLYSGSADAIILENDSPKTFSVVDNYSSLPSGGRQASKNHIGSSSGCLLTIPAFAVAFPLAQLLLVLLSKMS